VKEGDTVEQGTVLGATGNTGNARNLPRREDHLHFEIRTRVRCGLGLRGRISPLQIYGLCPLREPAFQNFSRYRALSAHEFLCAP
jgi:murein DD-endopeptidase MepM/ murein hydrolase activator NlpD